ncbi:MAG: hypothetical protein P1V18_04385 [Candidatus Gracilibacteria bacterium]|nr:hypothetical protein [Candidatus Gracilibacteria bacterium]
MSSAKYKKYFDQMFEAHRDDFMRFMLVDNMYAQDKRGMKAQFDEEGAQIKQIVHNWEDKLCKQMESGKNGVFSSKLGEKFHLEVTKYLPHFHEIGMKITFADD